MHVDFYGSEGEGNLGGAGWRETNQNTLHEKECVLNKGKSEKKKMKGQKYI